MLPFSHVQVILPNSPAASTFFFGNSLASWFLKNRSSFWHWNRMNILLYSDGLTAPRQWFGRNLCIFFCFGGCWMLLFSPRKAQFYTNDLIDLREMVNGSFFNGSFKRRGLFLQSEPKRRLLGILYRESLPFGSQTFLIRDAPLNRWCIYIEKQPSKKKSTI